MSKKVPLRCSVCKEKVTSLGYCKKCKEQRYSCSLCGEDPVVSITTKGGIVLRLCRSHRDKGLGLI